MQSAKKNHDQITQKNRVYVFGRSNERGYRQECVSHVDTRMYAGQNPANLEERVMTGCDLKVLGAERLRGFPSTDAAQHVSRHACMQGNLLFKCDIVVVARRDMEWRTRSVCVSRVGMHRLLGRRSSSQESEPILEVGNAGPCIGALLYYPNVLFQCNRAYL